MAHLFHRTRLSPVLLLLGVGGILNDDWQSGLALIGIGFAYWWAGELRERRRRGKRIGGAPSATVATPAAGSDGFAGAFSRLDPSTQAWLRDEYRAREKTRERNAPQ